MYNMTWLEMHKKIFDRSIFKVTRDISPTIFEHTPLHQSVSEARNGHIHKIESIQRNDARRRPNHDTDNIH